jgi:hypothetical protein
MILVDARAYFEHVQVIRCNIKPGSVKRFRDVENDTISAKIQRVYPCVPFLKHRYVFVKVMNAFSRYIS